MSNGTNNNCFICGKNGHFAKDCDENDCYETETESDDDNEDEEYEDIWWCIKCGKEFLKFIKCENHENNCKKNNCFRCGRNGHYASKCYASKHINGYYL